MKNQLREISGSVLFDEPLSQYTSIRIGGPADALVYPKTIEELTEIVRFARANALPLFVLGAGSNLLVRDKGIRGVVVNLSQGFGRIEIEREDADQVFLYAESGAGLPRLVDFAAEEGLAGLEVLSGIPGNVGGALSMNAGTRDGDVSQTVESVTFLAPPKSSVRNFSAKSGEVTPMGGHGGGETGRDKTFIDVTPPFEASDPALPVARRKTGPSLTTWTKEQIRYGYRESHFPKGAILLSGRFRLSRLSSEIIRGRIQKQRAYRLETQPLNVPNIGSVFKNPAGKKLFAAKLVEDTGLKDVRVGGARISSKHANWIVNEGGANARDVLTLIGLVRDKVKEKFGVLLETEVRVVGEE